MGGRPNEVDTETFLGIATAPGRTRLDRALTLYRKLEDVCGIAFVHYCLGGVSWITGNPPGARTRYREALRLARTIESDFLIGGALCGTGFVALEQDDLDGVRAAFTEAAGPLPGAYGRDGLADCLCGFASLALRAGDAEKAAILVDAADATRERIGSFLSVKWDSLFAAISSGVRAALGDGSFQEAHSTGMGRGTWEAGMRASVGVVHAHLPVHDS